MVTLLSVLAKKAQNQKNKMKLSQYRQDYYSFSGSASSVTRQAAFAGIALVWVFNSKTGTTINLPVDLLWPVLFLILCLASDLLQYICASAIWGVFHRFKEKELGAIPDPDVQAPIYLNWPTLVFFWLKHIFVLLGYAGLFMYVKSAIKFSAAA